MTTDEPLGCTECVPIFIIADLVFTNVDDYHGRQIFINWVEKDGSYLPKRLKDNYAY